MSSFVVSSSKMAIGFSDKDIQFHFIIAVCSAAPSASWLDPEEDKEM